MAQGNHNRSVKKAERALQAWFCAILSRRKKEEKKKKKKKKKEKEVLVVIAWTGSTKQIKGGCL